MKAFALIVALAVLCTFNALSQAGQPLVIKNQDGRFLAAAASSWEKAGANSYRFILKTGLHAAEIADSLAEKIAPIQVTATDELTLIFSAPTLEEADLLQKLSDVELSENQPIGDAMAALADLGSVGAPTMGDMSSAGSIRASKAIELPQADQRRNDPTNIVGEVVGFEPCRPMPVFHIKVLSTPTSGKHMNQFKAGQIVAIRGTYKPQSDNNQPDPQDPKTKENIQSILFPLGSKILGKPIQLLDSGTWIFETIEAY